MPQLTEQGRQNIRYALNHWDGLIRFLDDGRIELDSNSALEILAGSSHGCTVRRLTTIVRA